MPPDSTGSRHFSTISAVLNGNEEERTTALERIIAAHWKPLYKYIRLQYRISPAETSTITLNFLQRLEETAFFVKFDPAKQPLREFIRQKLDVFVPNPSARKPTDPASSLDFGGAEEEFNGDKVAPGQSAAEYYDSEWVRTILTLAVEELNITLAAEGKSRDFSLFMKLDLQDRSGTGRLGLEEIATELSMPLPEALDSLAKTRRRFQKTLMDLLRSFTTTDAEFQREARSFFQS